MRSSGIFFLAFLTVCLAATAWADVDPELLAKAQTYDQEVRTRHVPGWGGLVQNVYETPDLENVLYYRGQGDSTMWTGTYGATQAFRYAVTGEVEAKANAIAAVTTLLNHLRVTQTTGYVGRYIGSVADPAFWLDVLMLDEFRYADGVYLGNFYLSNSSSDQYVGFFHALSIIYDLVDDPPTRLVIREMVREVIDKLRESLWLILDENGLPTTAAPQIDGSEKLVFALIAAHILDTPEYWALYDRVFEAEAPSLPFNSTGFWNRYTEYFAMNLKHQNYFNLFRLEPDPERLRFYFDTYIDKVWRWVEGTHQVYFDYVYLTGCERLGLCEGSLTIMEEGVESLRLFQQWPNTQIFITPPPAEIDPVSEWLVDLQDQLPAWIGDLLDLELQAKEGYDVDNRCRQEYIWQRSPHQLSCGPVPISWPEHLLPGADYLMAYWLGRQTGYLDPHDLDAPGDDDDDDNDNDDNNDDDNDDDDNDDDDVTDDDTTGADDDDDDDDDDGCCG